MCFSSFLNHSLVRTPAFLQLIYGVGPPGADTERRYSPGALRVKPGAQGLTAAKPVNPGLCRNSTGLDSLNDTLC